MKYIFILILIAIITHDCFAGYGRSGGSGSFRSSGFSRSYSSPRSYSSLRSTYRPAPVVNHYHSSSPAQGSPSSSSFGSSFVGGLAGAAVGNAISNHASSAPVIVQQPVYANAPQEDVSPLAATVSAPMASIKQVDEQPGHFWTIFWMFIAMVIAIPLVVTLARR
jgi:hypothetical protein